MGNIIAFARGSYTHHLPEMFMKAATVAILLSPGLDRAEPTPTTVITDESVAAYHRHREQLRELLRDLASFLRRAHVEGAAAHAYAYGAHAHAHGARKLVFGLGALVTADPALVEPALPAVLLEGAELGMLGLAREDARVLERMRDACAAARDAAATSGAAAHTPGLGAHG